MDFLHLISFSVIPLGFIFELIGLMYLVGGQYLKVLSATIAVSIIALVGAILGVSVFGFFFSQDLIRWGLYVNEVNQSVGLPELTSTDIYYFMGFKGVLLFIVVELTALLLKVGTMSIFFPSLSLKRYALLLVTISILIGGIMFTTSWYRFSVLQNEFSM